MADKYREALDAFRDEIDQMHELVHDGFKAPEQVVQATPSLLSKIWDVQVEYAAMIRNSERRSHGG